MEFAELGLPQTLVERLNSLKYEKPYPIQEQSIPVILQGNDLLGIAQTGSGKTASFVLPILSKLNKPSKEKSREIDALVLVPTRELAEQVKDVFTEFSGALEHPVKAMAVYGGVSINPQMKALYGVNVLVATPGRLLDLVNSKAVHFNRLNTLVLDEADKMLNLGFKEEMTAIFKLLPENRQNLLFSATLSDKLEEINQILLQNPKVVKIESEENNIDLITQLAYFIPEDKKGPVLRHIIRSEKYDQILVFASSSYKADNIADKLRKNKIESSVIHGKKSQGARTSALRRFKEGSLKVLIATDILGRGIDIEFLPCVINYELPRSPKDYVHRIGRTGRAESTGDAISLIAPSDEHHFKIIQKKMKRIVDRIDLDTSGMY